MMLLSHLLRRPSVSLVKSERKLFRTVLRNFSGQNQLVPVPAMGDSISEGTVVEWLKGPGDQVAVDDVVVTLETDKVSVDVRAPLTGTISAILAKIDETVNVGAPLFEILEGEISTASAEVQIPKTDASEDSSRGEKATVNVPAMGDSISEGTVVQWLKGPGDYVKTDETVVIIETDKVSVDVNAPFNGYIVESLVKLDEVVSVGSPIYTIEETNDAPPTTSPSTPVVSDVPPSASQPSKSENPTQPTTPPVSSTSSEDKNRSAFSRNETRIKISSLRQRAAERLKDTQNTAAMLTTFQTCDMGEFLSLRKDLNEMFQKKHGVELGVLSAFVKAATCALQEVPAVNAAIDEETKEIVYNDFVDINIALASANGVISPVVRNCESMSIASIEKSINLLSTQVQEQKLAVEDLSGGTFSISNAGIYGSLLSSPFLNSPQSATLGIHGIKQTPVFHNGEIVARPVMYVALTYDHRLIDGKEAVTFLKSVTDKIADPRRLLLDL